MQTPRMIVYGKGYELTDVEVAELKLLYGDDVIVRVSDDVPADRVVTLNIEREPIGDAVKFGELMDTLLGVDSHGR